MTIISTIERDARRDCLIHSRSPFLRVIWLEKGVRQDRVGPRTPRDWARLTNNDRWFFVQLYR
jgi:hypothetical protein